MLERGGRRDIFLGTRECQGYIEPCIFGLGKGHYDDVSSLDLGLMEHGITYADENGKGVMQERFWHPVMQNGKICFCRPEECEIVRDIHPQKMKTFTLGETVSDCDDLYREVIQK